MISPSRLTHGTVGERAVFDKHGNLLDIDISSDIGPAALLVAPVTDAVKRVDDNGVESLDRDQMWLVEAIVLHRDILDGLEDREMMAEDLLTAVRDAGHSWQVSPISAL
jgi:hypothetical protein